MQLLSSRAQGPCHAAVQPCGVFVSCACSEFYMGIRA